MLRTSSEKFSKLKEVSPPTANLDEPFSDFGFIKAVDVRFAIKGSITNLFSEEH